MVYTFNVLAAKKPLGAYHGIPIEQASPPPSPLVLSGHAASLTPY